MLIFSGKLSTNLAKYPVNHLSAPAWTHAVMRYNRGY